MLASIRLMQRKPCPRFLSLAIGVILVGWIGFQVLLWGVSVGLQILYLILGVLILLFAWSHGEDHFISELSQA